MRLLLLAMRLLLLALVALAADAAKGKNSKCSSGLAGDYEKGCIISRLYERRDVPTTHDGVVHARVRG